MASDGSHISHDSKTGYDQVYRALEQTNVRMMGDHDIKGGAFEFRDTNGIKVGEIAFDEQDRYRVGKWYDQVVVSGRAMSPALALNVFLEEIRKTHG